MFKTTELNMMLDTTIPDEIKLSLLIANQIEDSQEDFRLRLQGNICYATMTKTYEKIQDNRIIRYSLGKTMLNNLTQIDDGTRREFVRLCDKESTLVELWKTQSTGVRDLALTNSQLIERINNRTAIIAAIQAYLTIKNAKAITL